MTFFKITIQVFFRMSVTKISYEIDKAVRTNDYDHN